MFNIGDRVMIIDKEHDVLLVGDTGRIVYTGLKNLGTYKPYSTVVFDRTKVKQDICTMIGLIKI